MMDKYDKWEQEQLKDCYGDVGFYYTYLIAKIMKETNICVNTKKQ